MGKFEQLVTSQMRTMDKLLFLQSEIERCQKIEQELIGLQEKSKKLRSISKEILEMKKELKQVQERFQEQTNEVIRSYHEKKMVM
ncbi:YgaB family protein [Bacillus pakistanensis]|uniref:YgaB family protein n=1 Tax=Rossellomorea pakistanensis TaxID=992288 RepID=UPI00196263E3|nr:YgaB family protein [Bacillus pakistanensis]